MKIKFRAWDTEKKEMATVLRMSFDEDDITLMDSECRIWNTVKGYIAIPMQCTGLKDLNDQEIYDGDILKLIDCGEELYSKVWFEDGAFWCDFSYANDRELLLEAHMSVEVVGNIYENTEFGFNQ